MKFKSIIAKRISSDTLMGSYDYGDYTITLDEDGEHWFMFVRCPGCEFPIYLRLSKDPNEDPRRSFEGTFWHWNEDFEKPTLKPSIGVGSHMQFWHGFFTDGKLEASE